VGAAAADVVARFFIVAARIG